MKHYSHIIDLTHTLHPGIPHWDGDCCFRIDTACDYADCTPPNIFRTQRMELKAGSGTHIDAPAHCFPGSTTVDALDIQSLATTCIVIKAQGNVRADYQFTSTMIMQYEEEHGIVPAGSFVIFSSGWDQYWNDPIKYRNDLHFPSVHEDAATLLVERNIAGIGIDTLSPDSGGKDFPVHRVILGAKKFIVENIANASQLPPTGTRVVIMPMKVNNGTEAPTRIAAFLP